MDNNVIKKITEEAVKLYFEGNSAKEALEKAKFVYQWNL